MTILAQISSSSQQARGEAPTLPGTVILSIGDAIPENHLLCDGAAINRTTYAALYAAIGDRYGDGDGSTTFNLPNYAGQFLRFHGFTSSQDPDRLSRTDRGDGTTGNEIGTKQAHQNQSHGHIYRYGAFGQGGSLQGSGFIGSSEYTSYTGDTNETRPKNINSMCVIRY